MPTHTLDTVLISPGSRYIREKQQDRLSASVDELASLRFSIILTGRWEIAASEDPERRGELREELACLRRQYSEKIDEIAMSFGVQIAMDAKDEVERTVVIPHGMDLSLAPDEDYAV